MIPSYQQNQLLSVKPSMFPWHIARVQQYNLKPKTFKNPGRNNIFLEPYETYMNQKRYIYIYEHHMFHMFLVPKPPVSASDFPRVPPQAPSTWAPWPADWIVVARSVWRRWLAGGWPGRPGSRGSDAKLRWNPGGNCLKFQMSKWWKHWRFGGPIELWYFDIATVQM